MVGKKSAGFTVIELIVAIGVFAIIIPALTIGVRNLILVNSRARNLTVANIVAESKAEELRGLGFNALSVGTTDITSELPAELSEPKQGSYEITNPSPGIKDVTVNVSYNDFGQTRELIYKTKISELGVAQ